MNHYQLRAQYERMKKGVEHEQRTHKPHSGDDFCRGYYNGQLNILERLIRENTW